MCVISYIILPRVLSSFQPSIAERCAWFAGALPVYESRSRSPTGQSNPTYYAMNFLPDTLHSTRLLCLSLVIDGPFLVSVYEHAVGSTYQFAPIHSHNFLLSHPLLCRTHPEHRNIIAIFSCAPEDSCTENSFTRGGRPS